MSKKQIKSKELSKIEDSSSSSSENEKSLESCKYVSPKLPPKTQANSKQLKLSKINDSGNC